MSLIGGAMAVLPVSSAKQITQLSDADSLASGLVECHLPVEDGSDTFLQRCVALYNNGGINLIAVPSQPAFDAIDTYSFFMAQQFYYGAIPQLRTNAAVHGVLPHHD